MASSITLEEMETRVLTLLKASGEATSWSTGNIDEGIRLALEEYSRARPRTGVSTLESDGARELDLASIEGLIRVTRIWFPFNEDAPEYPPNWIEFDELLDDGGPVVLLQSVAAPVEGQTVRIFYTLPHALDGLGAATQTTFSTADEGLLCLGAAGYACLQRSVDLNETPANMFVSTPNYGALADIFLTQFRGLLTRVTGRGTKV